MEKTIFEQMGGTYEQQGDYLVPCLILPAEEEKSIGAFGRRHLRQIYFQEGSSQNRSTTL